METEKLRTLLKKEFSEILNQFSREQIVVFRELLQSYSQKVKWDELPEAAKASILRGKEDARAGRYSDAFEYLEREG